METNYPLNSKIADAYALLNRHQVYFYVKKILAICIEVLCYIAALIFFVLLIKIPSDPIHFLQMLSENISIETIYKIKEVTYFMNFLRVIAFFFALLFLILGLLVGYIRRKDNRIRKATQLLEGVIKTSTM